MINWKVRFKNPVFWWQIALSIILPILSFTGQNVTDITSWEALGKLLMLAITNPFVLANVINSVWGTINDPTTAGVRDGKLGMTYEEPKKYE